MTMRRVRFSNCYPEICDSECLSLKKLQISESCTFCMGLLAHLLQGYDSPIEIIKNKLLVTNTPLTERFSQ